VSRRDWLYPALREHAEHELGVDNHDCIHCLTCLNTVTSPEEPFAAHRRHRLTVLSASGPDDEPFIETVRCATCEVDVVEAASFIYSVIVPERSGARRPLAGAESSPPDSAYGARSGRLRDLEGDEQVVAAVA
jgi:hypothetical protein